MKKLFGYGLLLFGLWLLFHLATRGTQPTAKA